MSPLHTSRQAWAGLMLSIRATLGTRSNSGSATDIGASLLSVTDMLRIRHEARAVRKRGTLLVSCKQTQEGSRDGTSYDGQSAHRKTNRTQAQAAKADWRRVRGAHGTDPGRQGLDATDGL